MQLTSEASRFVCASAFKASFSVRASCVKCVVSAVGYTVELCVLRAFHIGGEVCVNAAERGCVSRALGSSGKRLRTVHRAIRAQLRPLPHFSLSARPRFKLT